jgi:hypothetical protein
MISIYSSAFNLIKNGFDYRTSIDRFCNFAEEVVVCINSSEDRTLSELKYISRFYPHLVIVETDYSYDDPLLDGKIKNAALQATTHEVKVGLDMDEYIPQWQKPMWNRIAQNLLTDLYSSCYMVPSINLYKDKDHFFSITQKWYIHKSGLFRGPVNYAIKPDGTINTQVSDSCELIDSYGNIARSAQFSKRLEDLESGNFPFVVHEGYINLDARLLRNKNFWAKHWLVESGGSNPAHIIHSSMEDFQEPYIEHKLRL